MKSLPHANHDNLAVLPLGERSPKLFSVTGCYNGFSHIYLCKHKKEYWANHLCVTLIFCKSHDNVSLKIYLFIFVAVNCISLSSKEGQSILHGFLVQVSTLVT